MKRFSHQTRLRIWLAISICLAFSILLFVSYSNSITAQKIVPSRRPEIKEEKITRAILQITNRCLQPHRFRISSDIKDPRFKQQTDGILIGASSTKKIEVLFDAMGLKSNLKGVAECLDCKKEDGCVQDRYEVPIKMTAVPITLKGGPFVNSILWSGPFTRDSLGGGPLGVPANYVGIIPENECPIGSERVIISMDDQDDVFLGRKNNSSVSGWTGAISRYSTGTHFEFCRVDGNKFGVTKNAYAVLQLGPSCPPGSHSVERFFDNENTKTKNWASGDIAPSCISVAYGTVCTGNKNTTGLDTIMKFCLFPALGFESPECPEFYVSYGVFAAPSSAWLASGTVHTDDEDNTNNDMTLALDPNGDFASIVYGTDYPLEGRNTKLLVAKVANKTACKNPCPYIGSYDGANCWVGNPPPGRTAFIWSTNFYYTSSSGNPKCEPGSSWDLANCFVKAIPSQTKPFIWSNMWYVEPVCRP